MNVVVYEPGFMPGTGLSRGHSPGIQLQSSSTTAGRISETMRSSSNTRNAT
jgi:hypothetical protein